MADQAAPEGAAADHGLPAAPSSETAAASGTLGIEQLVREQHADVYRYAYRLCGSHSDAEDLVQQTFLVAYQKLHQLRDTQKARGWLFSVLRSCFLKTFRRLAPSTATKLNLDMEDVSDDFSPDSSNVDTERLQMALQQLPEEARLVVMMFYFEDASYKEIAEQLELKMGTVMSRLSRAKQRLRRLLSENSSPKNSHKQAVGTSKV